MTGSTMTTHTWLVIDVWVILMTSLTKVILCVSSVMNDSLIMMNLSDIYAGNTTFVTSVILMELPTNSIGLCSFAN